MSDTSYCTGCGYHAANLADRIEELEAENKRLRLEVAHANDTAGAAIERTKELEAKLEKTMEALIKIAGHGYGLQGLLEDGASDSEIADYWMREVGRRQAIAKAILAELSSVSCANLKGETDE